MNFRTKFTDNQLSFGAGANISTDDIPEGTQNFWLTTGSQDISGPKTFLSNIFTNGNGHINANGSIGNTSFIQFNNSPIYIGTVAGNITLLPDASNPQVQISNASLTVDNSITVGVDARISGSIFVNVDGANSENAIIHFNGVSANVTYSSGVFMFSRPVLVEGPAGTDNVFYVNYGGAGGENAIIYFNTTTQNFQYNGSAGRFQTSAGLFTIGRLAGSIFQFPTAQPGTPENGDAWWDATTRRVYIYDGTQWRYGPLI